MTNTKYFYRDINILDRFDDVANSKNYSRLPSDWLIIVTDILGSTRAIENGFYKSVNSLSAATITAILNVDRDCPVPFVFGGDGVTIAIPPQMEHGSREALLEVQALGRSGFNLEMRIGMVPVIVLEKLGDMALVAKFRQGSQITQTSFNGFAWSKAEELIKSTDQGDGYQVVPSPGLNPKADFTGFECRWSKVPASREFKLALIVLSTKPTSAEHMKLYQEVLDRIEEILGSSREHHPLAISGLKVSLNPKSVLGEAVIRTRGRGVFFRLGYLGFAYLSVVLGRFFMKFGLKALGVDWGRYKSQVIENADYRKFDGALKAILDCDSKMYEKLSQFLEEKRTNGHLVYGLHKSSAAIVTCIVVSHATNHAHFVDGSDGGYAMASKQLKLQLKDFKS